MLNRIQLHLETQHPETGESPFVVKDDASIAALVDLGSSTGDEGEYIRCPIEGCGEALLLAELESHVEMHEEEQDITDSDESGHSSNNRLKLEPAVADAFDVKLSHALRDLDDDDDGSRTVVPDKPSPDRHATAKAAWKKVLKMPDSSSRSSSSTAKPAARRRLGVRLYTLPFTPSPQHHSREI